MGLNYFKVSDGNLGNKPSKKITYLSNIPDTLRLDRGHVALEENGSKVIYQKASALGSIKCILPYYQPHDSSIDYPESINADSFKLRSNLPIFLAERQLKFDEETQSNPQALSAYRHKHTPLLIGYVQ